MQFCERAFTETMFEFPSAWKMRLDTWNTVSKLCQKLSKLWRFFSSSSLKLNFPPKTYLKDKFRRINWKAFASLRRGCFNAESTCMPRRAKITMKRKSRSNNEAIDCIEFNKEATKFDSALQYLQTKGQRNSHLLSRTSHLSRALKFNLLSSERYWRVVVTYYK